MAVLTFWFGKLECNQLCNIWSAYVQPWDMWFWLIAGHFGKSTWWETNMQQIVALVKALGGGKSFVPKPKQPQCGSLPVSHAGKEGLGIWPEVTRIYTWNAGLLNYWLIITLYRKYFFCGFRNPFRSMLTPTREAIDAAMTYRRKNLV